MSMRLGRTRGQPHASGPWSDPAVRPASEPAVRRDQLARYASIAHLVALLAQTVLGIATVRLTLPYLGEERFGAWMTVMGIAGLLTFADLGIGNALVTRVAAARAGVAGIQPYVAVTGGLSCLLVVGLCAGALVAIVCAAMPWAAVMRVPLANDVLAEFRAAAVIFGLLFGVSLFSSGIRKVYDGLQRGYVAHFMMAACSCISLALLFLASMQRSGLPLLILATFGVTAVLPLLLVGPLARAGHFRVAVALDAGRREWRHVMGVGAQYSVVQVGSLLLNGSEPMLVAGLRGSASLAELSVVQRLFQVAATPTRILVTPYWGAYADAHAREDRGYLRRTLLMHTVAAGFLTLVIAVAIAALSGPLLAVWTKRAISADFGVIVACCCLCVVDGAMLPFGMYLNGIGCVRPQAAATVFAAVTYFPLKVAALAYGGIAWMLWTTVAFQIFNTILFYAVLYRRQVWDAIRSG